MEEMRVCILSYQAVHKKTIDLMTRLKAYGYSNVCVYAKPFHYKKVFKPIYEHRFSIESEDTLNTLGYNEIIKNFGYEVKNIDDYCEIDEKYGTVFLIAGAGLVPEFLIKKYKIINSHPGYLPNVRGLDALKWAIIERQPIGVTVHLLSDNVDAGYVLDRRCVKVRNNDTFHMVAYRQYELEIQLLVDCIKKIDSPLFFTDGEGFLVHKRMPKDIEESLIFVFEKNLKTGIWKEK